MSQRNTIQPAAYRALATPEELDKAASLLTIRRESALAWMRQHNKRVLADPEETDDEVTQIHARDC